MDKLSLKFKKVAALSVALVMSIAMAGCSLLPKEEAELKPPLVKPVKAAYTTAVAKKGSFIIAVKGSATYQSTSTDVVQYTGENGRIGKFLVKAGDKVKKGDVLVQLLSDGLDLQVKEAELSLKRAKISFKQARSSGDADEAEAAQLQVEIEQIKYDRLYQDYSTKQLVAQMDGTVVSTASLKEGDSVAPYTPLVVVADPTKLWLLLQVSSKDMQDIDVGVEATVYASNKEELPGKVVQTPSSAPKTSDQQLADRYKSTIYITLDKLPADAEIGKMVSVQIVQQQHDNVIIIPAGALRDYLGRTFVRIMEAGDKVREVDVQPGLKTQAEVEIVKGLEEGQTVILQ
jgi:multidrug efflux pump subunit AcrA (membrane-fusion protein)